jgi:hypothetical protein
MEQILIKVLKLNFDLDDFYSITINPEHYPEIITLQGHPSPEKLLKYTSLGFSFSTGDNNRLVATKEKIRITLY